MVGLLLGGAAANYCGLRGDPAGRKAEAWEGVAEQPAAPAA
jgi:hypothetical protein